MILQRNLNANPSTALRQAQDNSSGQAARTLAPRATTVPEAERAGAQVLGEFARKRFKIRVFRGIRVKNLLTLQKPYLRFRDLLNIG